MSDITLPEVSVSTAPAAASGLLDEIMAQTRFKPESESYDIFPNEESITRLLGAVLTEQNEEWLLQNRYLPQHTMAEIEQTTETEVIEALPLSA